MGLKMPEPWKQKSGTYYYRARPPQDIAEKVNGQVVNLWFDGFLSTITVRDHVKVSLRTKDAKEAKRRFVEIQAQLNEAWAAVRDGPERLTHRNAVALAGDVYNAFSEAFDDDPGSVELWDHIIELNQKANDPTAGVGKFLINVDDDERQRVNLRHRYGDIADAVLNKWKLNLDEESKDRFNKELHRLLTENAKVNKRKAEGDYSADPFLDTVPTFQPAKQPTTTPKHTFDEFFANWETSHRRQGKAESTIGRYRPCWFALRSFIGHDNPATIKLTDLRDWKECLLEEQGLNPNTFRQVYRSAVMSVFDRAVQLNIVEQNPAKDLKAEGQKKIRTRDKWFDEQETRRILHASNLAYENAGKEQEWTLRAYRWVPWIMAYTGARVSEITQLRTIDLISNEHGYFLKLTPDAGTVKTGEFRYVPIHEHLVEQGLPQAIESLSEGPIFYNPSIQEGTPWENTSKRVAQWVREKAQIDDSSISPNHAWRHLFKTKGRDAGIDEFWLNAITGHAQTNEGGKYGGVTHKALRREIEKFPRFEL